LLFTIPDDQAPTTGSDDDDDEVDEPSVLSNEGVKVVNAYGADFMGAANMDDGGATNSFVDDRIAQERGSTAP
jgi:hypothetical protein